MEGQDLRQRIQEVEKEKNEFIEEAKKINKRLHYKSLELKALQPFIKENPNIRIGPYKKELRELEFRVSTQAFTPKIEKALLKQIKEVKKKHDEALVVENARRKARLVEEDITQITKRKEELDKKLSELREEINDIREKIKKRKEEKTQKTPYKKEAKVFPTQEKYLNLEEIVEFEGKE
ncbi:MAG: hypothetical protein WC356_00550 [Candidatus Micrarchaeia archaeon]|jgi:uncharacterized coiled-coil DUF342 family protein